MIGTFARPGADTQRNKPADIAEENVLPPSSMQLKIVEMTNGVLPIGPGRKVSEAMDESTVSHLFDQLAPGYRMDRRFGPVYDHTPAGADDLTSIRGIDTREAVTLNRLGVYYVSQIALWGHPESCAFAEEVGMSGAALNRERWVQQAEVLCCPRPVAAPHRRHMPASFFRTVSLLSCAVLGGCVLVYWLSLQRSHSLTGQLSAEITSLRVPTEANLLAAHVALGDEVFSGDVLLTLEKTEHLTMIAMQETRVQELKREFDKAGAQAVLDLEWRTRELDRELSDVRTRAHLIQEVKRTPRETHRSAARGSKNPNSSAAGLQVSRTASLPRSAEPEASAGSGMVFISGVSGESSFKVPRPQKAPTRLSIPVQPPVELVSESSAPEGMLTVEARSVQQRLERLEELRHELPDQVRQAAGVSGFQVQLEEAELRLEKMKTLSRDVSVVCPAYGKIGEVRYGVGDKMPSGEVMLKILHTDRRFVMLRVPTRRLNEIEPGAVVELRFPGNERYRGKISELPMLAEQQLTGGQSQAVVRVEPAGRLWPEIPIGSQIDVVVK